MVTFHTNFGFQPLNPFKAGLKAQGRSHRIRSALLDDTGLARSNRPLAALNVLAEFVVLAILAVVAVLAA